MFTSNVFVPSQFDSPDVPGSGQNMQQAFIDLFETYVTNLHFTPQIKSGFRTAAHNKSIGGAANSAHLRGYAVDLSVTSVQQRNTMIQIAVQSGFRRIGIYPTFIHLDNDPSLSSPTYWGTDYTSKSAPFNPFVGRNIKPSSSYQTASQPPDPKITHHYIDVDKDSTAQQIIDTNKLMITPVDLVSLNQDSIKLKYTPAEQKQFNFQPSPQLIKAQTKLKVPIGKIKRQSLIPSSNFVVTNISYKAFMADYVKNIVSNNNYKRVQKTAIDEGTFIQADKISVYILSLIHI